MSDDRCGGWHNFGGNRRIDDVAAVVVVDDNDDDWKCQCSVRKSSTDLRAVRSQIETGPLSDMRETAPVRLAHVFVHTLDFRLML